MCGGDEGGILRHNGVRDALYDYAKLAGYKVEKKHEGGLDDERRWGDIIIYNYDGRDRHTLIDVTVINPLTLTHKDILARGTAGAVATAYEMRKRSKLQTWTTRYLCLYLSL